MAVEDHIKLERFGLNENSPDHMKQLVLGPKPVRDYTAVERAYNIAKLNKDEKLYRYIVYFEAGRDYYKKEKNFLETMTFYNLD